MKDQRLWNVVFAVFVLGALLAAGSAMASPAQEAGAAASEVSSQITYQGYLTDANGDALSGSYTFRLELYDAPSAGARMWEQSKSGVAVQDGLFTVLLDVDPGNFDGKALWLAISIDGQLLSPRQELLPAPYALTVRPGAQVRGDIANPAVLVRNDSGIAVRGESAGGYGISGRTEDDTDWDAAGVVGYSVHDRTFGVLGVSEWGIGIEGAVNNVDNSNAAVLGFGGGGGPGVEGYSQRSHGVVGRSESDSSYAGAFYNTGAGATGVYGEALNRGIRGVATGSVIDGLDPTGVEGVGEWAGVHGDSLGYGVIADGGHAGLWARGGDGLWAEGDDVGIRASGEITGVLGQGGVGVVGESTAGGWGVQGLGLWGVYGGGTFQGVEGTGLVGVIGSTDPRVIVEGATPIGVKGATEDSSGHGGHFVNTGAIGVGNQVAVWAGTWGGRIIEGHEVDRQGNSVNDRFHVNWDGEVWADGDFHSGGADFAEMLPAAEGLEPGDVLVIGRDGSVTRSSQAFEPTVIGVYSTNPGFVGGSSDDLDLTGQVPVAVVGVVPVKASAENGHIQPGDLLVASSTPGHAMRAGLNPSLGTVLGKALQGLDEATGTIRLLVMLQ